MLALKIEAFRSLHSFAFGVPGSFHPIVVQRPDRAAMVTVGQAFDIALTEKLAVGRFGDLHAGQDRWGLIRFQRMHEFG